MTPKRQTGMARQQQAEAACLCQCCGRRAKLDVAIAANLKELGYEG